MTANSLRLVLLLIISILSSFAGFGDGHLALGARLPLTTKKGKYRFGLAYIAIGYEAEGGRRSSAASLTPRLERQRFGSRVRFTKRGFATPHPYSLTCCDTVARTGPERIPFNLIS